MWQYQQSLVSYNLTPTNLLLRSIVIKMLLLSVQAFVVLVLFISLSHDLSSVWLSLLLFVFYFCFSLFSLYLYLSIDAGERLTHHYVKEGVGIAVGLFLAALTNVGLFSLTSTPLNAGSDICAVLDRPLNEKVFLLMPVGYPAHDATVPYRWDGGVPLRKKLSDISSFY